MTLVANKTVLITGAAMGMGRLHADRAIERGASRLVLWDVNGDKLDETANEFRQRGAIVDAYTVDLANPNAIQSTARRVLDIAGPVDILFNNAGIVVPGDFLSHSSAEIEAVIRVNTLGVMHVAHAFLPSMLKSRESHLVNISSASALMPLPYGSVYASSKWAVYCWSESLRLELEDQGYRNIHVTTVCPSFVATGMFDGAKAPTGSRFLSPTEIVDAVWKGMEKNKVLVLAPALTRTVLPLRALLPTRLFDFVSRRFFGVYDAMKTLRGRGKPPISSESSTSEKEEPVSVASR